MEVKLGKWGNSTGVRIPPAALKKLDLKEGDTLDLEVEGSELRLKPAPKKYSLKDLLKQSPEGSFEQTDEDKAWLNDTPVGMEVHD